MSTYQLEQTGQQVQNILNEAPQTKLDLQSEIERATGKEGELAQAIADEKTRAEGIEGGLRTDLDAEIQRATDKDVVLENAIDAEETRAEGIEGRLRDDVDAIDAVIPNQASSSNQLADKAFVNSSIATNTADFKGTYNSLEQLETEVTDANANDYAFVIGTDQTGNTVYNRYKYVEGIGWEFEYALNNSSFTASQWAAINSAITAALVAKLTGLPTAEALTTSLNDLLTAIGAEKTRAELIEAGLRTDVNANAGAIVTEKNRAEGVEGTLTTGLSGEILNRQNADSALGLRIDGEATLRENADEALQGNIDAINAKIPTQASSSNQLADKAFVNSSIATNTAEFKGTYNSLETLEESVTDANANDYAFVISTDEAGNTVYNRYKYVEGTGWVFEYALNNSSFTASQWAAINSGITAALVAKLSALPTNDALTAALSAITDVIPTAASSSNKLIDAAQFVAALAAKADKATTLAGYGITDAYTKSETYSKTEVNGLVSTPHQNYVTVPTYASLPASGSTDTIYRVSSYDGANSQVDDTVYSEYAWNGSAYVFLCVKSQIDEVFDITVYNSNTKYADLAAALGTDGANIPQSLRRGGMSVKFVQSSDNKYVQYRLMSDTFNTTVANWQGVDDEPTAGSDNLVKSGGVFNTQKNTIGVFNCHSTQQTFAEFTTNADARNAVPSNLRVVGLKLRYKSQENATWVEEMYVGPYYVTTNKSYFNLIQVFGRDYGYLGDFTDLISGTGANAVCSYNPKDYSSLVAGRRPEVYDFDFFYFTITIPANTKVTFTNLSNFVTNNTSNNSVCFNVYKTLNYYTSKPLPLNNIISGITQKNTVQDKELVNRSASVISGVVNLTLLNYKTGYIINGTGTDGVNTNGTRACVIDYIPCYNTFRISVKDGYEVVLRFYSDTVETSFISTTSYLGGIQTIEIPVTAKYVRLNVKTSDGVTLPSAEITDVFALITTGSMQKVFNNAFGDGNTHYCSNEKIRLNKEYNLFKFQLDEIWKKYLTGNESGWDDDSINLAHAQSCAIYNDKMFVIEHQSTVEKSYIAVLDMTDGSQIDLTHRSGLTLADHGNSAEFVPVFLNDSDTYPLLMVSDFSNGQVHFYHVTNSGNDYTITLHKTVIFENHVAGNSVSYDYKKNQFINWYCEKGNYTRVVDNDVIVEIYNGVDLKSTDNVTFSANDVVYKFRLPYFVIQAGTVYNGKLFVIAQVVGDGWDGSKIWEKYGAVTRNNVFVINLETANVDSMIPFVTGMEPEGLAVYNGSLYVPVRHASGEIVVGTQYFGVIKFTF